MSVRGRQTLSRMLITFCDLGGSSRGVREYLLKNGDELKQSLPAGTQLITEIRRNHHPELRANYVNGLHLEKYSQEEKERELQRTGAKMWRAPRMSERRILRQRSFRMTTDVNGDELYAMSASEERRLITARIVAADTKAGREELLNRHQITRLTIPELMQHPVGGVQPRDWPIWRVWGPSGKVINLRNLAPEDVEEHLWWAMRTCGNRSTAWGCNVRRSITRQPTIQGAWTPSTAALLKDLDFGIQILR